MASMSGVTGWLTIPTGQESQAGASSATIKIDSARVTIPRDVFDDSSWATASNHRAKCVGMAGLTGNANCRIDKAAIPGLITALAVENDPGHAFVLYAERAARSLDFTGLLSRYSFRLRKSDPVSFTVDFSSNGAVTAGTTAIGTPSNSTGATLYGTGCYLTLGSGAPANGTTFNVEEMVFDAERELIPDDYFDAGAAVNWKRFIGGMYQLTGRASGPMIIGQPFSVGNFGTVQSGPSESYEIQLADGTVDGTYTFPAVCSLIGYSLDKRGRTIVEVSFESSWTNTTPDIVVAQPTYV